VLANFEDESAHSDFCWNEEFALAAVGDLIPCVRCAFYNHLKDSRISPEIHDNDEKLQKK
jgi:hypothetical protein